MTSPSRLKNRNHCPQITDLGAIGIIVLLEHLCHVIQNKFIFVWDEVGLHLFLLFKQGLVITLFETSNFLDNTVFPLVKLQKLLNLLTLVKPFFFCFLEVCSCLFYHKHIVEDQEITATAIAIYWYFKFLSWKRHSRESSDVAFKAYESHAPEQRWRQWKEMLILESLCFLWAVPILAPPTCQKRKGKQVLRTNNYLL